MKNLNLLGLYAILLITTGFMYGKPVLVPLALIFALATCTVSYLLAKRGSLGPSIIVLGIMGGILYLLFGADTTLNVLEFSFAGYIIALINGKLPFNRIFIGLSIFLFLVTCFEDFTFGMPQIPSLSSIANLRWGMYFLSSSILSAMMFAAIFFVSREDFGFQKVDFGLAPVLAFIIGGICMILAPLRIFGENLVIAVFGIFFVQGLSVGIYELKNVNTWIKFAAFIFVVILPGLALVGLGLIGMFDYWFDFRKLRGGTK